MNKRMHRLFIIMTAVTMIFVCGVFLNATEYVWVYGASSGNSTSGNYYVNIKNNSATLYIGGTKTLSVESKKPSKKKITWKSSDKSIATVSSKGKVTAKKKGTVTITAKIDGMNYKDTCKVTVKKPYVRVNDGNKVLSSDDTVTIINGNKLTLTAITYPSNKDVTWKSSNTDIVTVGKTTGKLTAKKVGTVKITASFKYKDKTYKKTCMVTVKNKSNNYALSSLGKWAEDLNELSIDQIEGNRILFSYSFYRLCGAENVWATLIGDDIATFEASDDSLGKKVKGRLIFKKDDIVIEFEDVDNFYEPYSLSEFIDGTRHTYKRISRKILTSDYLGKNIAIVKNDFGYTYSDEGFYGSRMLFYSLMDIGFVYNYDGIVTHVVCGNISIENDWCGCMTLDEIMGKSSEARYQGGGYDMEIGDNVYYADVFEGNLYLMFTWYGDSPENGNKSDILVITKP